MNQFVNVFLFELRYWLRRPTTYIYFATMFGLAFLFMTTDAVTIGGSVGKVLKNAPFVIARTTTILTFIGAIITTAIAGTAVLRDFQLKSHELFFTTPLTKISYLGARFVGAVIVMIAAYSGLLFGTLLGTWMPWLEADKIAPFSFASYWNPFILFLVPNIFFMSALFFAVGTLTRNLLVVYVQGIALLVGFSIAGTLLSDIENKMISALLDPFGVRAFGLATEYWTTAEKNSMIVPFTGYVLWNRLLWLGIGAALFAMCYLLFRFEAQGFTFRKKKAQKEDAIDTGTRLVLPIVTLHGSFSAQWQQWYSMTRFYFGSLVREIPFLALAGIGIIMTVMNAANADRTFGTLVYPVTYSMIETLNGNGSVFSVIIIAFYAGELVWKERGLKLDQATDVLPVPSWTALVGKISALLLALVVLYGVMTTGIVGVQLFKGFTNIEFGLYLRNMLGVALPNLIQFTFLAFFVHIVVNNKFIGHLVIVSVFLASIVLGALHVEHNLLQFGSGPSVTYSDMNGYGHFVRPMAWFNAYWFAFATLLVVVGYLFWVRGTETSWRQRFANARLQVSVPALSFGAVAFLLMAGSGGFIYYNTNVLNTYRNSKQGEQEQADYEKMYRRLKDTPQPRIQSVKVNVDIFPEERFVKFGGSYTIINKNSVPVDSIIVSIESSADIEELTFNRAAKQVLSDKDKSMFIYRLDVPLQPRDTALLTFKLRYAAKGFSNSGTNLQDVTFNGTFINNSYLPHFGYFEGAEIGDDDKRKENGLPPKERMAALDDPNARLKNYISTDADWVDFETVVSTVPDQIAIAPGYLQREWTETVAGKPRRYFHYKMDSKILNFYAWLSARYDVKRDVWKGADGKDVTIEIYYHKGHEYNLERMVQGVKKSLDYFTVNFSPYQHRQMRILEFPRYASFAQSFPNTVPYSEAIGFIARVKDAEDLDYPFYVTAHEVGHQWWAHQVIGGNVQGATLMSESLAEYSALMVMEKEYGKEKMKKFLGYDLDRYLRGRSAERKKEQPLMLAENQAYIHYAKGSMIMYALKDYIGEERLNAALKKYLQAVAFQEPPYTNAREFVNVIREAVPDSLKYLVADMFETITLFDNKTQEAKATKLPDGRYKVELTLESHKFRADSLGTEKEIALGDWVDVGVFDKNEDKASKLGKPLYFAKHKITQPKTMIDFIVNGEPHKAGIDPYNKLIDRVPKDNVKEVSK
jgi:hypothetical protein